MKGVSLLLKSAFDAVGVVALLTGGVVLPGLQGGHYLCWAPLTRSATAAREN